MYMQILRVSIWHWANEWKWSKFCNNAKSLDTNHVIKNQIFFLPLLQTSSLNNDAPFCMMIFIKFPMQFLPTYFIFQFDRAFFLQKFEHLLPGNSNNNNKSNRKKNACHQGTLFARLNNLVVSYGLPLCLDRWSWLRLPNTFFAPSSNHCIGEWESQCKSNVRLWLIYAYNNYHVELIVFL